MYALVFNSINRSAHVLNGNNYRTPRNIHSCFMKLQNIVRSILDPSGEVRENYVKILIQGKLH